jgi:hypothetical protein
MCRGESLEEATHRWDSENDPQTPDRLGNHIEDTKEEHLGVSRELAGSLAESPDDGVGAV